MDKIMEREIAYKLTLAMKNLNKYYTLKELKMAKNKVWYALDNMNTEDVEHISKEDIYEFEDMLIKYLQLVI